MGTESSARIASPAVSFGTVQAQMWRDAERPSAAYASVEQPLLFRGDQERIEGAEGTDGGAEGEGGAEHVDDSGGGLQLELGGSDTGDSLESEPMGGIQYPPPSPNRSRASRGDSIHHASCSASHWLMKPPSLAAPVLLDQMASLLSDSSRQLHEAIDGGYYSLAEHLIDAGWPLHARDAAGRQPLHLACEANCKWLVQKLVLAGGRSIAKDKLHRTALECASSEGVATALAKPPRWSRGLNLVFPWDFKRRVVALAASMELGCGDGTGIAGVVPRHFDLLETVCSALATAVIERGEAVGGALPVAGEELSETALAVDEEAETV